MTRACWGAVRGRCAARRIGTLIAAGLIVGGCSVGNHVQLQQPPASDGPASPNPTAVAETRALTQYTAFWSELTPASRAAPGKRLQMLSQVSGDPELASLLHGMAHADQLGQVFFGQDVPRPKIAVFSLPRGIAVIDDCADSRSTGLQDRKTGRHLTVGVSRNHIVATMHLGADGEWRVVFVTYPKTSC